MIEPVFRAIGQLDDPAVLRVLGQSLLLSAACFVLLAAGSTVELHHLLAGHGWIGWVVGALGGAASIAAAVWLFLPLAVVIASAFQEPVCRAVERRYYPALPPARGADVLAQLWDGVVVGLLVLGANLLGLVLALAIPGVGLVIGWVATAWALGRGIFVAVAMRRMERSAAQALYRRRSGSVLVQGAALTLLGSVPILNLLLPVLATAAMVHAVMDAAEPGRLAWKA